MNDDVNGEEFDDLRDIEALLAGLAVDDLDVSEPPADVWAGIEQRLTDDASASTGTGTGSSDDARRPELDDVASAEVRSLDAGRRRRSSWMLAAAAAVVLAVAGAVAVVATRGGSEGEVVSAAPLTFDPTAFDPRGSEAAAEALLVERDGRYSIRLSGTRFPELAGDDDLELWLIQPDANGNPVDVAPVALIDPDSDGWYTVPSELDPTTHYVVDISIEPRDGDASHSGQSILRGALEQR